VRTLVFIVLVMALAACAPPRARPAETSHGEAGAPASGAGEGSEGPALATAPEDPEPTSEAPPSRPIDPAFANERAPNSFRAKFETTKGSFVVEVHRHLSPHGADRFFNLVSLGYFRDVALYRVVKGFVVQFGIHGDPRINTLWREATLPAEPVSASNLRGTLSYAMAANPETRTVQVFINLVDNVNLDGLGFAPFANVVEGMDVVEAFFTGYGNAPAGDQATITERGNDYLRETYPELDYIKSASVI
jgi:peptidyl-prolyl cis-trans isomerase A (cyclophilin A)